MPQTLVDDPCRLGAPGVYQDAAGVWLSGPLASQCYSIPVATLQEWSQTGRCPLLDGRKMRTKLVPPYKAGLERFPAKSVRVYFQPDLERVHTRRTDPGRCAGENGRLTSRTIHDRWNIGKKTLEYWSTIGCPYLDGGKLRRWKELVNTGMDREQRVWVYDAEEIHRVIERMRSPDRVGYRAAGGTVYLSAADAEKPPYCVSRGTFFNWCEAGAPGLKGEKPRVQSFLPNVHGARRKALHIPEEYLRRALDARTAGKEEGFRDAEGRLWLSVSEVEEGFQIPAGTTYSRIRQGKIQARRKPRTTASGETRAFHVLQTDIEAFLATPRAPFGKPGWRDEKGRLFYSAVEAEKYERVRPATFYALLHGLSARIGRRPESTFIELATKNGRTGYWGILLDDIREIQGTARAPRPKDGKGRFIRPSAPRGAAQSKTAVQPSGNKPESDARETTGKPAGEIQSEQPDAKPDAKAREEAETKAREEAEKVKSHIPSTTGMNILICLFQRRAFIPEKRLSMPQIAKAVGASDCTDALQKLRKVGILAAIGGRTGGHWLTVNGKAKAADIIEQSRAITAQSSR